MHIVSKYDSRCKGCGVWQRPGDTVDWIRGQKGIWCARCHPASTPFPADTPKAPVVPDVPHTNGKTTALAKVSSTADPILVAFAALEDAVIDKITVSSASFDVEVERAWSVVQKSKALALQPGTPEEGKAALRVALIRLIKLAI